MRLRADVCDREQVAAAVHRMEAHFGPPQILICAHATFGPIGPLATSDPGEWAHALTTNITGAMNLCRAVLPGMLARRWGKILLLVGPGAEGPRPAFSAYASAQAAIVRFAETLAEEVRDANIQVNCVNPGATYTSLTDDVLRAGERAGPAELQAAAHVRTTGGTPPDKQIHLVQFLCSERSNHISGKLIAVGDDWRKLEHANTHTEMFTLRRTQKV